MLSVGEVTGKQAFLCDIRKSLNWQILFGKQFGGIYPNNFFFFNHILFGSATLFLGVYPAGTPMQCTKIQG